MESIETLPLAFMTWEVLVERYKREGMSEGVKTYIGNVAEGYPFPTNLDRRVPETAGMAPESEQDLLVKGLREGWDKDILQSELKDLRSMGSA